MLHVTMVYVVFTWVTCCNASRNLLLVEKKYLSTRIKIVDGPSRNTRNNRWAQDILGHLSLLGATKVATLDFLLDSWQVA